VDRWVLGKYVTGGKFAGGEPEGNAGTERMNRGRNSACQRETFTNVYGAWVVRKVQSERVLAYGDQKQEYGLTRKSMGKHVEKGKKKKSPKA